MDGATEGLEPGVEALVAEHFPVVVLPGQQDPEALKALIGETAELEFKLVDINALQSDIEQGIADYAKKARDGKRSGKRAGNRGTGRRDLKELALPEERVEITDPHLERLVAEGKVVRQEITSFVVCTCT